MLIAQYLIQNPLDIEGINIIDFVIKNNYYEHFKYLFNKKNIESNNISYTFNSSCEYGSLDILKYLIKNYIPNLLFLFSNNEILSKASINGHLNIIKYLTRFMINLDININNKIAIVMKNACEGCWQCQQSRDLTLLNPPCGHLNIIQYLVEEYNIEIRSYHLEIVCKKGYFDIIQYFINQSNDINNLINPERNHAFVESSASGNLDIVKYLEKFIVIIQNININRYYCNSLVKACEYGHLNIVKYFIEKGIDYDKEDRNSFLYHAIDNNHIDIVKYLIEEYKIDLDNFNNIQMYGGIDNKLDKYKNYILDNISKKGYINIIKYFIEECKIKYDFDIINTAIKSACKNNHFDIVSYLIDQKK